MVDPEALRQTGERQARWCGEAGAPTYEAIIAALVDALEGRAAAVRLLRSDGRDPWSSAVYLRLLGAVQRLAMRDPSCPLRRYYPTLGGTADAEAAVGAFFQVVEEHQPAVAHGMRAEVQTNEVGRSAPLSAAMNYLGGPLRVLEVGASAGLNLWLDHYRVEVDTRRGWGPEDSAVRLVGHFDAGEPPLGPFRVIGRRGCDIDPIDLADPDARDLLRSFVWPDHVDRLQLLEAAMAVAEPVPIDAAAAGPWLRSQLESLPEGITTVVVHSIITPYLSESDRRDLNNVIERAAERADDEHRLAWVALEPDADDAVWLVCRPFPGSGWIRLATAPAGHGRQTHWDPMAITSPSWSGRPGSPAPAS
jgi:hypothetical protein